MVAPLNVFAVGNKQPEWVGWANTLAQAFEVMREAGAGSYFVFSEETANKNFLKWFRVAWSSRFQLPRHEHAH